LKCGVVIGSHDIGPDAQRFLMRRERSAADAATIKVVVNWIGTFKALSQKEAR
jgi:hypothetical protein